MPASDAVDACCLAKYGLVSAVGIAHSYKGDIFAEGCQQRIVSLQRLGYFRKPESIRVLTER